MGRTAVYTIGHVYKSPFKDAMVKTNSELQELRRQEGQEREAAQKAIELADLILKDLEHPDRDPIATDWDTRQTLKAVKACHYAHSVLSKEAFKNPDLLRHSLRYWIDALARLNHYDDAIELSKEYVTLLSDVDDLMVLYEAYHEIAGLYFCRGHDQDHAKFDDFDNARRFYSLERRALDQLPGDTEDLEDIKRSSDLNMGIIEAKEMGGLERAQTLFTSAFKTAAKLGKYIEQQTTAWEMGNAYRNHGHLEQLAKAQGIELSVIRRHKLKDKEVLVRFEIVKTRIEMGHYEKSRELLDDLRGLLDTEEINEELDDLEDIINYLESRRIAISKLPDVNTLGPVYRRAVLFFELGKAEFEENMLHTALRSTRNGIREVKKEPTLMVQLAGLLLDLKQLEADILWKIRQSPIDELETLNEEILVDTKKHCQNKKQRLEHLQRVYERMADLYYYFEKQEQCDQWDTLYNECTKQLQQFEDEDEMTRYNEDEELNEAIASMEITTEVEEDLDHQGDDGTQQQQMDPILTVRVALNINNEEKLLFIQVMNDTKCIDWLMEQVAQKAWESYGYEPDIFALETEASGMLLSQELVVVAIQGNYERVFAHYDGFREKTPLELYQNACMRMHVPVRRSVELALENNNDKSGDEQLVLADACLVSRDIPVICDLLRHIKPVTKLDLSGNVLYDHDIADVFRHIQDLHHVDLSSNRLTSQTIARFVRYPSLRSLSISFNPLGCDTLGLLPELLNQCPQLASLDLESCDIRNYTLPDPTRHAYQHLGHRLDHLNLSYNPSSDDSASLEQWKSLVQNLVKDNGSNGQQILNCK